MTVIQGKPIKEALAREPQSYPLASRVTNVAEPARIKYLRVALRLVGLTFIVRNLHVHYRLAIRLGHGTPAIAQLTLSPDDSGCVCDAGRVSVDCEPQSARKLEPHLVHGVVQRCTRVQSWQSRRWQTRTKLDTFGVTFQPYWLWRPSLRF